MDSIRIGLITFFFWAMIVIIIACCLPGCIAHQRPLGIEPMRAGRLWRCPKGVMIGSRQMDRGGIWISTEDWLRMQMKIEKAKRREEMYL